MAGKKPETGGKRAGADQTLVARMIGRLGDQQTVEQKAGALAAALCEPLAEAIRDTTGLAVSISRGPIETGLRSEFEAKGIGKLVRCPASIQGWCYDFSLATDARLAIAFAESLLGGGDGDVAERPLSMVELDISIVLFEETVAVLKRIAGAASAIASTGAPAVAAPRGEDDETPDVHAVVVTLQVNLGRITAPLALLLPQAAVLKTEIATPEPEASGPRPKAPEWTERLSRQVSSSDVTLKGHISLERTTLGAIARLQPGDVLAFADTHDVEVRLEANGRQLGWCELGRSGNQYMLRLKPAESLEDELMRGMAP
ncbi:MAG TPA: FliM/FliN family flagellar motor switch protein [Pararhizobium sp.]|nr:FliM/FliN family flagellar motor switch protein [Pararhizobium sp.]